MFQQLLFAVGQVLNLAAGPIIITTFLCMPAIFAVCFLALYARLVSARAAVIIVSFYVMIVALGLWYSFSPAWWTSTVCYPTAIEIDSADHKPVGVLSSLTYALGVKYTNWHLPLGGDSNFPFSLSYTCVKEDWARPAVYEITDWLGITAPPPEDINWLVIPLLTQSFGAAIECLVGLLFFLWVLRTSTLEKRHLIRLLWKMRKASVVQAFQAARNGNPLILLSMMFGSPILTILALPKISIIGRIIFGDYKMSKGELPFVFLQYQWDGFNVAKPMKLPTRRVGHVKLRMDRERARSTLIKTVNAMGLPTHAYCPSANEVHRCTTSSRDAMTLKDLKYPKTLTNDRMPKDAAIIMVDVDFYVDLTMFGGRPIFMYTWRPEDVGGSFENEAYWSWHGDRLRMTTESGSQYEHGVWNYFDNDFKIVRGAYMSTVYTVKVQRTGVPNRVLVALLPVTYVPTLFLDLVISNNCNEIKRFDFGVWSTDEQIASNTEFKAKVNAWWLPVFGEAKPKTLRFNRRIEFNEGKETVQLSAIGAIKTWSIPSQHYNAAEVGWSQSTKPGLASMKQYAEAFCAPEDSGVFTTFLTMAVKLPLKPERIIPMFSEFWGVQQLYNEDIPAIPGHDPEHVGKSLGPGLASGAFLPSIGYVDESTSVKDRGSGKRNNITLSDLPEELRRYTNQYVDTIVCARYDGGKRTVKAIGPHVLDVVKTRLARPSQQQQVSRVEDQTTDLDVPGTSFTKGEAVAPGKANRKIDDCIPAEKVEYSQFLYALVDWFKATTLGKVMASGMGPEAVCDDMQGIVGSAATVWQVPPEDLEIVCGDFSSQDGGICGAWRSTEAKVLGSLFSNHRKQWRQLHNRMRPSKFKSGAKNGVGSMRSSGSPETSFFNTLYTFWIAYMALSRLVKSKALHPNALKPKNLRNYLRFLGDDSLIVLPKAVAEEFVQEHAAICSVVGATWKVEDRARKNKPRLMFLGRIYPDLWTSGTSYADTVRQAAKFHSLRRKGESTLSYLSHVTAGWLVSDSHHPVLGPLANCFAKMINRFGHAGSFVDPSWNLQCLDIKTIRAALDYVSENGSMFDRKDGMTLGDYPEIFDRLVKFVEEDSPNVARDDIDAWLGRLAEFKFEKATIVKNDVFLNGVFYPAGSSTME